MNFRLASSLLFFILFFGAFIFSCKNSDSAKSKAAKLSTVYKDKLTAAKISLDVKIGRLRRMPKKDTAISNYDYQKDRVGFLKLIVETNYYNLSLKTDAPDGIIKASAQYYIVVSDTTYNYGKNKKRFFCDEDALHVSDDFNKNWPVSRPPHNTFELADYLYHKSELIDYLLINKCY